MSFFPEDFAINLARTIIVLFIIVDPFGSIPILMSLTEKMGKEERRKIFNTACIVGFIVLLIFAFLGREIFMVFGISIESFEVAGGILLLIIAIRILITGGSHETVESPESIGAVPIAMPLLVGPGAITTSILSLQQYGAVVTAIAILVVIVLTWVILRFIGEVYRVLGKTGSMVIARAMALIIAAIAVQYVLVGLTNFFM
ncbi:MAG: MarC family protein [Candidatus Bathyarchaeota archaeon]|nr:MarC family protein [Candidatus Bathyarchaeota archaeon]